jgi:hypothetical protein
MKLPPSIEAIARAQITGAKAQSEFEWQTFIQAIAREACRLQRDADMKAMGSERDPERAFESMVNAALVVAAPDSSNEEFVGCRHEWVHTGVAYGGDDERYHGEGRCYCMHCGADGDA